jgi:hypothetical protein
MRVYVVRLIESRDLVGIFVATNPIQLQIFVDECTDIDACEYALMPAGGVYWDVPAIPVPVPEPEGDASIVDENGSGAFPDVPWGKLTPTDAWYWALHNTIRRWRPLFQESDVFSELEMDRADEEAARPGKAKKDWRHLRVVK